MFNCPFPTTTNLIKTRYIIYIRAIIAIYKFSARVWGGGGGGVEIGAITAEHVIVIRMLLKRDNLYWEILQPGSFNQIIRDNEAQS